MVNTKRGKAGREEAMLRFQIFLRMREEWWEGCMLWIRQRVSSEKALLLCGRPSGLGSSMHGKLLTK